MTTLSAIEMQKLGGEGFWQGVVCGAAAGLAVGLTISPEPYSKLVVTSAWVTALGACGIAVT